VAGDPRGGPAAFHALISGSVQGVGFRYSARQEARMLGLVGWVRNLPDGDVEVLAEGESSGLADFRAWLEEGPPGALIRSIRAEKRRPTGHFVDFTIEY
jgi:acylphosphatase